MHLVSLVLGWLSLIFSIKSSLAFSSSSIPRTSSTRNINSALHVASVEIPSVSDMERGVGGRIEDAFASAKEKGEAAFVTFVTAGYPRAAGKLEHACSSLFEFRFAQHLIGSVDSFLSSSCKFELDRHTSYSSCYARGRC